MATRLFARFLIILSRYLMRNPRIPTTLRDGSGFVWASGEFNVGKIKKLVKVYHSAGIEVSAYVMGSN